MHSSSAWQSETENWILNSRILVEVFSLCLGSAVRCFFFFLHLYHPGQSGCGGFAVLLPRNPFQIQSGVASVAPLVALKDCDQWPLIWVTQLSCCALLMYREPWQYPGPWRHRWKRWRRRWGDGLRGAKMGQFQRSWLSAILLSHLFLHINKTVVLIKGQVEEARVTGSLSSYGHSKEWTGWRRFLSFSLTLYCVLWEWLALDSNKSSLTQCPLIAAQWFRESRSYYLHISQNVLTDATSISSLASDKAL